MVLKLKKLFLRCLDKVEQQPCGVAGVMLGSRIGVYGNVSNTHRPSTIGCFTNGCIRDPR